VARSIDVEPKHLESVLEAAAAHKGSAFVEVFQNCNVFNDGAFEHFTGKDVKADLQLHVEHGKPLLFGKDKKKGIRLAGKNGLVPEVVEIGVNGVTENDILVYDAHQESGAMAYLLSRFELPNFPVPIGVFRSVERPTYERQMEAQMAVAKQKATGDIEQLLRSGETWQVT
jgi:2-oxoglutarate ferredoxin oxidoreductase subunit beta